ncbi:MAG: hypothetical protein DMG47_17215 [Acidobacteria bacterium]|nr:MAG: hypothetical protein DMG47_17215 [Acidobacteriota bacterium]
MNILKRLPQSRLRPLMAPFGVVALIVLAAWVVLAFLRPMPQRSVVMAVYPEGTLNADLVKRYRDVLAHDGIELKLEPSAGAVESLARLRDPTSATSIALIPGGITTEQESPGLVSLGTLFYQPLWIFSRGHLLQRRGKLRGLRISIGPEGSSSRALSLKLLGRAEIIDPQSATLLPFTPAESAEKLIHGEIDVAVFLDAWESSAVQQLVNAKDVNLASIHRADAFVALYPFLNKLVLPAGVVDMAQPRPPEDVLLIATKSSLLVRNDLHPAIQYLLLEAAAEIHSTPGMFQTTGQFPAPESIDVPLSPYAREFYKTGAPFLQRHLPFWLAMLLEQPLVWIIPLVAILFPFFRLAPAIYDWAERRRVYKLYSELKRVEVDLSSAAPSRAQKDLIERLDRLKDRATRLSVPTPFKPLVYSLRLHIDMVRQEAQKSIAP